MNLKDSKTLIFVPLITQIENQSTKSIELRLIKNFK
jgi:hypothetical protein